VRKLILNAEELKTRTNTRFEFNQNVNVAIRSEIIAEYRTEQRQSSNAMSPAEIRQALLRES